jgi:hypothetical protein
MRAFGEGFMSYRPPVDLKTITKAVQDEGDSLVLNFITRHQKWGIHATCTDNLMMLTLNRGGPVIWISETDAKKAGIYDCCMPIDFDYDHLKSAPEMEAFPTARPRSPRPSWLRRSARIVS